MKANILCFQIVLDFAKFHSLESRRRVFVDEWHLCNNLFSTDFIRHQPETAQTRVTEALPDLANHPIKVVLLDHPFGLIMLLTWQ